MEHHGKKTNSWKIIPKMGNSTKNMGKSCKKMGTWRIPSQRPPNKAASVQKSPQLLEDAIPWENHGTPWENNGKQWENQANTMGKQWEKQWENHGKTIGKLWKTMGNN